ncbi:unnamed protein product [Agarophyton chilense]
MQVHNVKRTSENGLEAHGAGDQVEQLTILLEEVIALETEIKEIRLVRMGEKRSIDRLRRIMVLLLALQVVYLMTIGFSIFADT